MMKIYVYHWMGGELKVSGVYQEGEPSSPNAHPPHWMDVPEEELGNKLKELADHYDVMFLNRDGKYRIYLDNKGKLFRTR